MLLSLPVVLTFKLRMHPEFMPDLSRGNCSDNCPVFLMIFVVDISAASGACIPS